MIKSFRPRHKVKCATWSRIETKTIRSSLEDSPTLPFFFRLSLLMLCLCCKVRDTRHTSHCVKTTKHNSSALVFWPTTHTQHKKRVPIVEEEMSQVLFSIVTGIKGAMIWTHHLFFAITQREPQFDGKITRMPGCQKT